MQAVFARIIELHGQRQALARSREGTFTVTVAERLAEIAPGQTWVSGRSLQAGALSVIVHLIVLVQIGLVMLPGTRPQLIDDLKAFLTPQEPPVEPLADAELQLADPSDEPAEQVFAATTSAVGAELSDEPRIEESLDQVETVDFNIELPQVQQLAAAELSEMVVRKGTIGDSVMEVEGAVDRITHEIVTYLEQSKVLVVWMMDASISLADERTQVANRLERVFRELDQLGSLSGSDALENAVVAFGQQWQELVAPTADEAMVVDAIRKVPTDETGSENVFTALLAAVDKYRALRGHEQRKIMVVIWTDESGDDDNELEDAVRQCQKLAVPVFAVGPSSMFGRVMGTHAYVHPEDGKTYQLPVNRGPDSVRQELLRLPYWFEGPQLESVRAGVGPFSLTRLTQETGGAYFVSEQAADRSPFSLATMRNYLPDYNSATEYVRSAAASPLRKAVLQAVEVTHRRELRGAPRLSFAPTGETFQDDLREAQQTVAYNSVILDQALEFFGPKGLEEAYQKEAAARWRAFYDLTFGRLLAMRVRCNEYNWACAQMRGKGSEFVDQQSNRWKFKPDAKINFGTASERAAAEATRLLKRCVEQNPNTPWALLAQRELKDPLGIAIEEGYEAPPKDNPDLSPANNQLPGRVVEQQRMLQRPVEPKLPKL
ncbi:MAG: VWA domain-containing protein [Pirellulales bacterium]|nr:VWA domain-containing protein [Pirellulales bacterium]